jgi:hypothetical protein
MAWRGDNPAFPLNVPCQNFGRCSGHSDVKCLRLEGFDDEHRDLTAGTGSVGGEFRIGVRPLPPVRSFRLGSYSPFRGISKLSYRGRLSSLRPSTQETLRRTSATRSATLLWLLRLAGHPSARPAHRRRCGRYQPQSSCVAVHGPKSARGRSRIACQRGSRRVRIATLAVRF